MVNLILNSIKDNLNKEFPQYYYYKNGVIKKHPSFYLRIIDVFTKEINLSTSEQTELTFYIRVEHRLSENPQTIEQFNTRINEDGLKILKVLRKIKIKDHYYTPEFTTNEVVDFVRVVEFNFKIFIQNEKEKSRIIKEIKINGGVKK